MGLGGRGFRSVALRRAEKEVFRKEVLGRRSELERERERNKRRSGEHYLTSNFIRHTFHRI